MDIRAADPGGSQCAVEHGTQTLCGKQDRKRLVVPDRSRCNPEQPNSQRKEKNSEDFSGEDSFLHGQILPIHHGVKWNRRLAFGLQN